ncbi:LPS export ABC transporter periplasmic protein LptC [Pedobacter xixiisoli]|uniref:Lipopolysaccharide-assembly, LptC-related n=1 Tax=Pedobacter xixiisoli TaxID=1476464 RepID=A0A286ACS3_9SPHI|nr:hypothetical protein [Pedobacter xixiisoli]SOD19706.1 Lipopolysaccharide-assembly, LptC-related [Pedobacter xixiisoli]
MVKVQCLLVNSRWSVYLHRYTMSIQTWAFYCLLFIFCFLLSSCGEDDLKKVPAISANKVTLTKDRTYGAEVIYSDSAKVKAKGYAPILDKVTPSTGAIYMEMPKGVKIYFLDEFLKNKGTITSDYAINKETERITIFKKNVVVVTDNMTFTTEELTWNENTKMYNSPSGVVTTKDGNVLNGTSFSAPQDFSTYSITMPSGTANVENGKLP